MGNTMNKESGIQTFTEFQMFRLNQLDFGIRKIKQAEAVMKKHEVETVIVGEDYDHEVEVDKEILHVAKGFLGGVYQELKAENMKDVADIVISLNKP